MLLPPLIQNRRKQFSLTVLDYVLELAGWETYEVHVFLLQVERVYVNGVLNFYSDIRFLIYAALIVT